MVDFVVYSNTDFEDILQIQTDQLSGKGNLTLLINKSEQNLDHIYNRYDKVIFYNNNNTYPGRLKECIEQIDQKYFILIHEHDILLNVDLPIIEKFFEFIKQNDLDRIDLKQSMSLENKKFIKINNIDDFSTWIEKPSDEDFHDNIYFTIQKDPDDYIYNVNPSIWKRDSILDIVSTFQHRNYRDIENIDVQHFCTKFKVLRLYSKNALNCGYYNCLNIFKFLHITHSGKLLPFNSTFTTVYGQSYEHAKEDYIKIIDKYNLRQSNKWVN